MQTYATYFISYPDFPLSCHLYLSRYIFRFDLQRAHSTITMGPESDEELFAVSLHYHTTPPHIPPLPLKCLALIRYKQANPTTPNKRAESQIKPDPDDSDSIQQTPTKKPKTSPSKRSGPLGPIPTSYEDATHEDKMIIQMREVEGKSWAEIRAVVGKRTGASFGASSLQIRYSRMKANFIVISEEEVWILIWLAGWLYRTDLWIYRNRRFCRRRGRLRRRWTRKNGRGLRMFWRRRLVTSIPLLPWRRSSRN